MVVEAEWGLEDGGNMGQWQGTVWEREGEADSFFYSSEQLEKHG